MMRALAIICAYNEEDIIGWTVRNLIRQGISVHVIDTASTDDTVGVARKAGAAVENYPVVDGRVSWRALLQRVEQLANDPGSPHHWYMHCDADEIRYSPCCITTSEPVMDVPYYKTTGRPETLLEAFERMDGEGYNAAEFEVFTYQPTAQTSGYDGTQDPEKYFTSFTRDLMNERIGQVKAWKRPPAGDQVMLAWSGGHRIRFTVPSGCALLTPNVHPLKLISKHYPIRSQAHGERKVFAERRGRWSDPEADWHIQYHHIKRGYSFLVKP